MPDITVIPPFKIADDIWLPTNSSFASETLEDLASTLMVTTINSLFPNLPVSLNLDGTINVAGVDFALEFNLCPKICPPGTVKSFDGKSCGCPEGFTRDA